LIALIIFAISPKIKFKLPKAWQYYIWLAVIFRLIFPYTPEVSLMGAINNLFENTHIHNIAADFLSTVAAERILGYVGMAWLLIVILLIVKKVISYIAYTRFIRANGEEINDAAIKRLFRQILSEMKIEKPVALYSYKGVNSPMLMGIFKPCIVLPEAMPHTKENLRYVFIHELTHYKKRDFLYKWLIQIISCIHFFNPLVHLIKKEINKIGEFSCDESVIKHLDKQEKNAYGSALLDVLEMNLNYMKQPEISLMLGEDATQIKGRLTAIAQYQKSSQGAVLSMLSLTSLICLSCLYIGIFKDSVCLCIGNLLKAII
jgi:beta-lactamase regulating signal transducer with metallopeptidase domain